MNIRKFIALELPSRLPLILLVFMAIPSISQAQAKPNSHYAEHLEAPTFGSIFPVEDIQSITVSNNSGKHTLTTKELTFLKEQLIAARYGGGLLVKPGHISLSIKLRAGSKAKLTSAYAYTGIVNFNFGTDRFGKRLYGTYYLPLAVNFDNYR